MLTLSSIFDKTNFLIVTTIRIRSIIGALYDESSLREKLSPYLFPWPSRIFGVSFEGCGFGEVIGYTLHGTFYLRCRVTGVSGTTTVLLAADARQSMHNNNLMNKENTMTLHVGI